MEFHESVVRKFGISMSDYVMSGISDYIATGAMPETLRRDMLDRDLKGLIDIEDENKLKKTRQRTLEYNSRRDVTLDE